MKNVLFSLFVTLMVFTSCQKSVSTTSTTSPTNDVKFSISIDFNLNTVSTIPVTMSISGVQYKERGVIWSDNSTYPNYYLTTKMTMTTDTVSIRGLKSNTYYNVVGYYIDILGNVLYSNRYQTKTK